METCAAAGIVSVMITGDHPLTASTVGREVGILGTRRVVSRLDLDAMTNQQLERDVAEIAVYARVSAASIVPVIEMVKWTTRRGWLGELV